MFYSIAVFYSIMTDMTRDDVDYLLEACSGPLTDDDLVEMIEYAIDAKENEHPDIP